MAQHLNPNADISNFNWHPTVVFDQIAQEGGSTVTTNIYSPPGALFEVHLEDGVDPESDKNHKFIVELKGLYIDEEFPDEAVLTVNARLLQGSTLITSIVVDDPPETFTKYQHSLTESEAQLISDYTDLRVKVDASYAAEDSVGIGG